jgi:hypothetical protein
VAKLEGDGWLSWREMGGYVGRRWVAKLVGDGWLRWTEMGGLVGRRCVAKDREMVG